MSHGFMKQSSELMCPVTRTRHGVEYIYSGCPDYASLPSSVAGEAVGNLTHQTAVKLPAWHQFSPAGAPWSQLKPDFRQGGAACPDRRQLGREPTAQVVKSSDGLPSNFARVASSISLPPSPTAGTAAICGPNEAVKKLSFTHEWAAPQGTTAKHFTNREPHSLRVWRKVSGFCDAVWLSAPLKLLCTCDDDIGGLLFQLLPGE